MNGRKRSYGQHRLWLWGSGKRNCIYCGLKLTITPNQPNSMTLEHLKPLSRGGYNKRSNYAPACRGCNNGKGSATVEEFERNIIHRPQFRTNRNG